MPASNPPAEASGPWARALWPLSLIVLFGSALAWRVHIASGLEHPGHGDPAFYFDVARNLAERGRLEIDYIWHYLSPPDSLTHAAGDYWMVFSSVLMALPLVLGGGLLSAVGMAILFGLLSGVATLGVARALGASKLAATAACAFVLFEPNLFNFSTSTNAPIFYTAFVTAALACTARGARVPRSFAWAGLFAALAHATRQDGLFLAPTVGLAICLGSRDWRAKRRALLMAAGAYLLAMAPIFLCNMVQLGAPLPSSLSRTIFARSYEDIYAYAKPLDWQSYRAWGWDNIWRSKRAVFASNGVILRSFFGWALWGLVVFGVVRIVWRDRERRPVVLAAVALLALQILFYGAVGTAVATEGAFLKAGLALVPFLIVVGFDALDRCVPWSWVTLLAMVALGFPQVEDCLGRARKKVEIHNDIGRQVQALHGAVEASRAPGDPEPVLMTRHPWELHTSTGYGAVQVPNDDLETILEVARRYGVTHIVLPVPRSGLSLAEATADPRFELAARLPGSPVRVFRLVQ
ncbi:MAG: hypothetical protein ACI8Y8_003201 [Planctomycetota bacterium]